MKAELRDELQSDDFLQALLHEIAYALADTPDALRSCVHGLQGGAIEKAYSDFDLLVEDPSQAAAVADLFARLVAHLKQRDDVEMLAFLKKNDEETRNTVGTLLLAGQIASSEDVKLPHKVIRLDSDILHQRIKFERGLGPLDHVLEGVRVAIISDHSTRGKELLEAADTLRAFGGIVVAVVVLTRLKHIFEDAGAEEEFASRGIEFYHFFDVLPPGEGEDRPSVVPNTSIWREPAVLVAQ